MGRKSVVISVGVFWDTLLHVLHIHIQSNAWLGISRFDRIFPLISLTTLQYYDAMCRCATKPRYNTDCCASYLEMSLLVSQTVLTLQGSSQE